MALPKRFTVEPIWAGCTAIVLCTGPSASLKQVRAIARARLWPESKFRVIAVNDAIYGAWWADWHHACDWSWWAEHIQHVHTFPGIKTTLAEDVPAPWVTGYLENSGNEGFDPDPSRCRTGNNSGYQAIHIAAHAGAKRIVLVGMDMKMDAQGNSHNFGEHRDGRKAHFATVMLPMFPTIVPALEERGIEVVNATPGSALTTFPMVDLDEELRKWA